MVHLDKLSPQLQEWIRVLMLPPEQITGEDAEKRSAWLSAVRLDRKQRRK